LRFALHKAGKGGHFGAQGVRLAFGAGPDGAGLGFKGLGRGAGLFGADQRLFGGFSHA
jgi:hypothetical protein